MSAQKPEKTMPTWKGIIRRQSYGSGGDIGRVYSTELAAIAADAVIWDCMIHLMADELPGCWAAAFRGALRQLNVNLWMLNIQVRKDWGIS